MKTTTHIWTEPQKAWLAALRSGEYKQCRDTLKSINGGFCCLGVACDISPIGTFTEENYFKITDSEHFTKGFLSIQMMLWLGLTDSCGRFSRRGDLEYPSLADMNDSGKFTFEQIADFIEKNPEIIFVKVP
jgi:hypothetical protein